MLGEATTIDLSDFERVDMRVGRVLAVDDFPEARRPAWKLEIDFGPEIGVKRSSAQLTEHYRPDALVGRQVAAVVNFAPKQIGRFMSEVLVLGFPDQASAGVLIAPLTLHCGVSSLEGDEDPYPEPYDVPPATAELVNHVRARGNRVIAGGTTVVRALETVALAGSGGRVIAGAGWTSHVVTPETGVRAVDGLLTGLHEPRSSHLRMLAAFAGPSLLSRCYQAAVDAGYLWHEFGDVHLLLP